MSSGFTFRPYFFTMANASSLVDMSGAAGPDAMLSSLSPSTSLSTTMNTCAGAQSCANLPPLTLDKCLRMVLISTMSAPQAKSWLEMSCMSAKVAPSAGSSNNAEPPPLTKNNTVSSGVRPLTCSRSAFVPLRVFSSRTGCPAS